MKRKGWTDNSDILIHHMLILRLLTVASLFNYIGKLYISQAQMLFFCHDGRDLDQRFYQLFPDPFLQVGLQRNCALPPPGISLSHL